MEVVEDSIPLPVGSIPPPVISDASETTIDWERQQCSWLSSTRAYIDCAVSLGEKLSHLESSSQPEHSIVGLARGQSFQSQLHHLILLGQ